MSKVRKEEDSDEECIVEDMGSDNEAENNDDADMEVNEEIQVDFEGFQISDNDFHGIRQMLQQLFPRDNVDTSEIADTIMKQNFIGTVLKQSETDEDMSDDSDDTDEVFGVTTCLSLNGMSNPCQAMTELKQMLLGKCRKHASNGKLAKILDSPKEECCIGWIVNERFINVPPQVSLPMFEKLSSEIAEAAKHNHKNSYDFSHYFLVCKTYDSSSAAGAGDKMSRPKTLHFINAEEELFFDEAAESFSYPLEGVGKLMSGQWDEDAPELQPYRTLVLLERDSLPKVVKKLREHLSLPGAQ